MIFKKSLIIIFLLLPFVVEANVIINEIAWMGTSVSYNDEWIELYNNGDAAVNLDNWILKTDDGTPEINLSGTIPAKGFFLLERTDDETVPGISADLIYKGALGNDGENLKLFDSANNIVNQIICLDAWPAGDNTTKQTMEKIGPGWQNSQDPSGTPKSQNSAGATIIVKPVPTIEIETIETTPEPQKTEENKPAETKSPLTYPKGVVFNEILASPDGPDAENEWIEIYNGNDFEVDLSGWQIKDSSGKITTYILNKKIPALGYLVFLRPETKITLNNDGDELTLLNPKKEIIDSIVFGKASLDQSYAKTSSGWTWTTNLTPGEKNIIPQPSQPAPVNPETARLPDGQGSRDISANVADINLGSLTSENRVPPFLIAFLVALFCSIAFLIIKNNLKSFWY